MGNMLCCEVFERVFYGRASNTADEKLRENNDTQNHLEIDPSYDDPIVSESKEEINPRDAEKTSNNHSSAIQKESLPNILEEDGVENFNRSILAFLSFDFDHDHDKRNISEHKIDDSNDDDDDDDTSEPVRDIHVEASSPPISPLKEPPTPMSPISLGELKFERNAIALESPRRSVHKTKQYLKYVDDQKLKNLSVAIPDATNEELIRFLIARKGDYKGALDQLRGYIAWRKECNLDEEEEVSSTMSPMSMPMNDYASCASSVGAQDCTDWKNASKAAFLICKKEKGTNSTGIKSNSNEKNLPQLAHMVTNIGSSTFMKDKQGNRILQLLPGQTDMNAADEATYALAVAIYLDKKLSRESMENIVVAIDVRAGQGWANPPAKNIIPFIKRIVSILERNFPERLSKCVLYPLPAVATILWKMIKGFLDPNVSTIIVLFIVRFFMFF